MLKIISGTFENGNGITIHDTDTDNYYHKVVYKDSVEINGKIYYKNDFRCFITYEEPIAGRSFTYKQMKEVYRDMADKNEYPNFESWFTDMMKSGVFKEVQKNVQTT